MRYTHGTVQVGFHPDAPDTFNATLTVTRCTHWTTDPTGGRCLVDAGEPLIVYSQHRPKNSRSARSPPRQAHMSLTAQRSA